MKLIARTIVAALALTTILAPVAVGQTAPDANDHRRPSVVPASNVAGNSGGRLLGDWFVENLTLSASASPFGGSANICFDIGHRGKVLSPAGDPDSPREQGDRDDLPSRGRTTGGDGHDVRRLQQRRAWALLRRHTSHPAHVRASEPEYDPRPIDKHQCGRK